MSLDQHAPTTVVLAASAPEQPNFGISALPGVYDSQQVSRFLELSGGISTIRVTPSSWPGVMETLGVDISEVTYIEIADHFGGQPVPDEAYLTFRGTPDKLHIQTLTLNPDTGSATQARVGEYRVTDIEGGPFIFVSPGVAQVTDLEIADAGGGDGATGKYQVSDSDGNLYIYQSGGTNLWTFVVLSAAAGLYTVTAEGVLYSYTATGADTVETIRDGVLANMNNLISHPGGHPEWISNTTGTDTITLTGSSIGLQLTVTSNLGPGASEASITETTPLAPETVSEIATAIDAVITSASPPPPVQWTTSVVAGIITATAQAAFIGKDLGVKIAGPAAPDATTTVTTDHRQTVTTVITAIAALIAAAVHPSYTDSFADPVITLTGTAQGVAITVAVSSPSGTLVLKETQSTLTLRSSQVTRITIVAQSGVDAYDGAYVLSLLGENLNHTALGPDTITDVRDALQLSVDTNVGPQTSTVAVGSDAFDITFTEQGLPQTVLITSPGSNAGANSALQTPSQGAVDDFDRAVDDQDNWYHWLNGTEASDTDIKAITIHVDNIQQAVPRRHWAQSANQAIPDTPTANATDIGQFVKDTGTRRTTLLWNPVPSSPTQTVEGMIQQWVGSASSFLPGQIQFNTFILSGVSGGQKLTALQEGNLRDKAVAFVEFVGSLGATGERITNGPYTASGRQQDITRAIDQIKFVYQNGATALLAQLNIVPYNDAEGIGLIDAFITSVTNNLIDQGLVIDGTFFYLPNGNVPLIEDQTDQAKREAGIFPEFKFQITIQVGGVQIPIFIEVGQ